MRILPVSAAPGYRELSVSALEVCAEALGIHTMSGFSPRYLRRLTSSAGAAKAAFDYIYDRSYNLQRSFQIFDCHQINTDLMKACHARYFDREGWLLARFCRTRF
jgi:hypothetical protein